MTKDQELQILRDAARQLDASTYCGGWLADIIPAVERDIRSDIVPTVTWAEIRANYDTERKRLETDNARRVRDTETRCAEMLEHANKAYAETMARARHQHDSVTAWLRRTLRDLENA